ncbi:MAG: MFS transporter [Chloroflexota bacterium]|nr:MFS transporter [Chloroflexota bacterium]
MRAASQAAEVATDAPGVVSRASEAAAQSRTRSRLPQAFASLRHRNYRLLWSGTLISSSGDWMDQIALNWLVYQLTNSGVALGLLNFCRLMPILVFTLIGGVVADRVERRKLIFATQTVSMLLAFALAILVSTGLVEYWMVLVIAVGRGVTLSFNQPARQSLISDLVPREDLMNAIALNSATMNLTRVIGPAIGGILIATVGVAGAFYVNGASFLAVLCGLALMRFPPPRRRAHSGLVADLLAGMRYLLGHPRLRTLVLLAVLPMVFGMPYMTMLAVFASDVLHVGGPGLGLLMACSGAGAVLGALFVASLRRTERRDRIMLGGLAGFGLALLAFSSSPWLWLSALTLLAVGACQQLYMSINNSLIQEDVDEQYRGRIMSTLFLNRGAVPLGAMLAGLGADLIGVQVTVGAMAALLVVAAVAAGRVALQPRPVY